MLIQENRSKLQLEQTWYTVITADSGEKSIEIFKNNNIIDLVLMDIDLGRGMDGMEAGKLILKYKIIHLAFLSSYTEP